MTDEKRMLVLADAFPVLSETFVADHARMMGGEGWDVTLLIRKRRPGFEEAVAALGKNVSVVELPRAGVSSYLRAFSWLFRHPSQFSSSFAWRCALHGTRIAKSDAINAHWDVVHAHYGNNGVSAVIANPEWRTRLVVNFHGHDVTSAPARYGWKLLRQTLRGAFAIAHSDFVQARLSKNTTLDVKRVTMGADCERFTPTDRSATWSNPLRLLSIGRLSPQKGHAVAIEALRLLRERRPQLNAHLTIVGAGPERRRLKSLIDHHGLSEFVSGLSPRPYPDMPAVLQASDVLLLCSQVGRDGWEEAFCRVAVEGMACGVPVVGCPSGGLSDTIGDAGRVAQGFDGASVADAVIALINQNNPSEWSLRARERATRFSTERMAEDYAELANLVAAATGSKNDGR